jgi:flavodoxin/NAD-dependent dihydropyrimidine dehydrogenase PreA subunit
MKSIIIYFSQTGNTKKIARAINAGISQVIQEAEIASIKDIDPADLDKYDLIGLGSPVWASREPQNVTDFISAIRVSKGKHAFSFCTHGASPAGFEQSMASALKKKGLKVIGFYDCYGRCLIQVLPKPYLTDGHPDDIDLREAEDFGREMAERSRMIYLGKTGPALAMPGIEEVNEKHGGHPVGNIDEFEKMKAEIMQSRIINPDKCTGCGLCAANCPFDSIDLSASPPAFKSSCFGCFFCEQVCPEGAIEMDFTEITKVHDKIVRNIFMRELAGAEAKGHFRRLVKIEDIGWNTHWYQISGHPRYVIE